MHPLDSNGPSHRQTDPSLLPARGSWRQRLFACAFNRISRHYGLLLAPRKKSLFADLHGDVLEIGPGTGANLELFPAGIRWIGLEPNPWMHPYLRREAALRGLPVDLRLGSAEHITAPDQSLDAVVGTLVLCSVNDVAAVLREVRRVLKPGGKFVFLEHVAAPRGTWLRRTQRLIRPITASLGDGCHPDRETWVALENAGFGKLDCEKFLVPVPLNGPHIAGTATKA